MPKTSPKDGLDPVDVHIGATIREKREAARMTQSQLGDKIGVTFQQLQKYERGLNRIAAARLLRIAEALGEQVQNLYPGAEGAYGVEAYAAAKVRRFASTHDKGTMFDVSAHATGRILTIAIAAPTTAKPAGNVVQHALGQDGELVDVTPIK